MTPLLIDTETKTNSSPKSISKPRFESDQFYAIYSMPQRVGHASLGNLEVLHQEANGSTIGFTHCEQENGIT